MDTELVAEKLQEKHVTYGVPGVQVGLLSRSGRAVLCAGTTEHGRGSGITPDTTFHAGSIAKSLTALVVLDAHARGEIDVEAPCDQQCPGSWDDTPLSLMAQTSGRANELPGIEEDLASFVARVREMPRMHAPGRFSYCNAGWSVLDLLLRERVGGSFEELAADRVLGATARFGDGAGGSVGHAVQPGSAPQPVPSVLSPAASAAGSRWWVTADELLDYAELHLDLGAGRFPADAVEQMQQPHAAVPGLTIADAWGLGWAVWLRPGHTAYGWAGFTGGHRAYLRCFPEQRAAVVVLANAAGPLFGPPGGSALFDDLLPTMLQAVGVPPVPTPTYADGRAVSELVGGYGPFEVSASEGDGLLLDARAFGTPDPVRLLRSGGDTFEVVGRPPGAMPVAFDSSLLYLGPFAMPMSSP